MNRLVYKKCSMLHAIICRDSRIGSDCTASAILESDSLAEQPDLCNHRANGSVIMYRQRAHSIDQVHCARIFKEYKYAVKSLGNHVIALLD